MKFLWLFLAFVIHGCSCPGLAWNQAASKVVQVDQGSGISSVPNYWKSGDAEVTLTGVAAYAHPAAAKPTTCSGGSPAITVARSATAPMYDKQSWLITKPVGDLRGQGVAFEFDVDNGIAAVEMMDLLFEYIVGSGTFAAGSDTTNSDIMVYLYDVTAGQLIEPYGGSKLYTSSTTLKGDYRGWFQSTLGSKKYRVCLHQATTSASAYTLKVDAGKVQKSINTLNNFTKEPTVRRLTSGSGTYTTPPGVKYLIVEMVGGGSGGSGSSSTTANNGGIGGTGGTTTFGSSLLIATGGSGSGTYSGNGIGGVATVNSPAISIVQLNGASGNAGVYNSSTTNPILFGSAGAATPLGGAGSQTEPLTAGKNAVANTGSGGGGAAGNGSFPSVTGSGGSAGAYIKAQINSPSLTYAYAVGAGGTGGTAGTSGYAGGAGGSGVIIITEYYSEPARMSDGYDGREIAAKLSTLSSPTITANTALAFNTKSFDRTNSATLSSFTAPTSGIYRVTLNGLYTSTSVAVYVYKGGVPNAILLATTSTNRQSSSTLVLANAGDVLTVASTANATASSTVDVEVMFEKLSGTPFMSPTALWETHYAGTAGDAIGTSDSLIKFTTKVEDTFGSYNPATGLWTAKGPATCSVGWAVNTASVNLSTSQRMIARLFKDNANYADGSISLGSGVATVKNSVGNSYSVKVITGTELKIMAASDVATTAGSSQTGNYFTVSCRQSGN